MHDVLIYHSNCPSRFSSVAPAFRDYTKPIAPVVAVNLDHQFRVYICDLCGLKISLHFATEDLIRVS